jgi:multidrug efflux pump subunit AcrA (membrane-fusion protein)
MFLVMLSVANWVKYPDQIELPFVLRGSDREMVYTFSFPVYVKEVYVQPGDQVEAGQPLIRLSSPEIASMIAELEGRTARKETFENFTGSSYQSQLEILDKQILQLQARYTRLQSEMDLLDQQWSSRVSLLNIILEDADEQFENSKKLYQEGVISRYEFQEKEQAYVQARDNRSNGEAYYKRERLALQTNLEETMQSMAATRLEQSRLDYDKAARSGDLDSDATAAGDLIKSIFGQCRIENGSVILLSPEAHSVSFVFEGDAEINPGVTVLKLNQATTADYAFIKCPPSAAGKLKEGMKVHLKVASFPYYEWGVAEGHVSSKSISPDENGEYNMQVSLDHLKRLEGMLFPGLDGTAVLILEEKTLFQYFFRDLAKAYHRAAGGDFAKPR